jgi:hypothetical protein
VVWHRRVLTRYGVFVAGVGAGVGFAAAETIAFALGAGALWSALVVMRAPVALIHVTGTALAAYGWYWQTTRGGTALVTYFGAAAIVHGAWNSLIVAVVMVATTVDPEAVSGTAAGAVLGLLAAMVILLAACGMWVVRTAWHLGRGAAAPAGWQGPVSTGSTW